ncbi:MAG TPA: hypothetical protein VL993_01750 [Stellaceae bacterium]|nr:hypothetical protein [Stellaceae bacterium]
MLKEWGHERRGDYAGFLWRAATDPAIFASFRRDPQYRAVVETVWQETGQACLDRIADARVRGLCLGSAEADAVGDPVTFTYGGARLAPTTLRYGKILDDLIRYFPDFSNIEDVVEIGIGHGGQARLIAGFAAAAGTRLKTYSCLDLAPALLLARQYLEHFRLAPRFRFLSKLELDPEQCWGLAISNYAFSELGIALQEEYLERVLSRAEAGYLTMNSGLAEGQWRGQTCLTAEALLGRLPNAVLCREDPATAPDNYVLLYGRHAVAGVPIDLLRSEARARAAATPVSRARRRFLSRIGAPARG